MTVVALLAIIFCSVIFGERFKLIAWLGLVASMCVLVLAWMYYNTSLLESKVQNDAVSDTTEVE